MIMKYNKTISLTAFLLSLSLILLLEAASLGFLAEDIKPVEKKEVEIELLLTASNNPAAENTQAGNNVELKESENEQEENDSKEKKVKNEEVDKSSSNKNEEKELEKIQQDNDLKIEEKVEEPKKEAQEAENNEKLDKIKPTEQEETSLENKELEKKQETMPAWLNNSETENKKDNSKKAVTKNKVEKEDKFDLDSYLAELENDDSADQENEVNKNLSSSNQNSGVNEPEEAGKNRDNKSENKAENKEFSTEGAPQNNEKKEVYDLRNGENGIEKPGLKNYTQPEYPSNLRKRNIEGEVIISLRIDKAGKAHDLKISQSSGYDSFDQAALSAVSNWRFEAAEKDGIKVEVIVNLPIRFKLN